MIHMIIMIVIIDMLNLTAFYGLKNLKRGRQTETNSGYFNILNNCLSKSPNKFHSPAGSNVWNVWVHFQGYVFAFNTYRSQSNMTDRTGGEKCKDTQAICWKWEVSRESQPIFIAKSRWPKKNTQKLHDRAVNRKFGVGKMVTTLVSLIEAQENNFHILGAIKCIQNSCTDHQ